MADGGGYATRPDPAAAGSGSIFGVLAGQVWCAQGGRNVVV